MAEAIHAQTARKNAPAAVSSRAQTESVLEDARPEAMALHRLHNMGSESPRTTQLKSLQAMMNATPRGQTMGLPNQLKSGVESLSGMSMDQVKVHYNSDKPAQLQAHAYAQGNEIHVAPGQEQHLPHEAWHVVQQAQGRVRPTLQMKGGVPVNDDAGLENEADVMGAKSLQIASVGQRKTIGADQVPQIHDAEFQDIADKVAAPESEVDELATEQSFLVDGEGVSAGQMDKTSFLDALKSSISKEAEVELAKIGQTTENCPYLRHWISYYQKLPAKTVERAIRLYTMEVLATNDAQEVLAIVTRKVIANLRSQIAKSPINPVTEDNPDELTAPGAVIEALIPPKIVATQSETAQLGCWCSDNAYQEVDQNNDDEEEDLALSEDLKQGVNALIRFNRVAQENTIIERITNANKVHQKVFNLLTPIRPDIKTYMQGSGGQVQNALSLIGKADKEQVSEQTLQNMVFNFCAVYDPNDLDFSDVDILVPVKSTATFGKEILLQIKRNLTNKGAEIRSAAILGGTSSFSHIFLKLDGQDIDIVIQDQRFAELFAPRLPHMSARADIRGNPGFIRTQNEEDYDADGYASDNGFSDLTEFVLTRDMVTAHMKGGLNADADLNDKDFDFEEVQQDVEEKIVQFRQELLHPERGVNGGKLLGEKMKELIAGWKHKKEHKSEEIAAKLLILENDQEIEREPRQITPEQAEFRKNQKQYYKSAKLVPDEDTTASSLAHKKSVVAFYHMLARHLNPGELSATQVADFTASLLAKKGFADKTEQNQIAWLTEQIAHLKNVQTYFGALIAMEWGEENDAVKNAADYFLMQQAIFEELIARIQSNVDQEGAWPPTATGHLKERAYERGISADEINDALRNGTEYDDPDFEGGTVYFYQHTGVSVCEIADGLLTTCYRDLRPKDRWVRRGV